LTLTAGEGSPQERFAELYGLHHGTAIEAGQPRMAGPELLGPYFGLETSISYLIISKSTLGTLGGAIGTEST
jgi:hypothetical protein